MKETIESLLRHAFTALLGLGTFLYSQGYIGVDDVTQVNADGTAMASALSSLIVVLLSRLFLKFSGKLIVAHAADMDKEKKNDDGGLYGLLLLLATAGLFGFALPSCSLAERESIPVRASYVDKRGNVYAYDPRTGVSVQLIEAAK